MNHVPKFEATIDTAASDRYLVSLAKSGDSQGFSILFVRYRERLFHAMIRLVGSSSDADDLVQSAFLVAFTKLDSFREEAQFYSWVFRIAVNQRRSYFKHVARETLTGDLGLWHDHPSPVMAPDTQLEIAESNQRVRSALKRISPHHRAVLMLREYERLSYREIGERLGIALGTVRSRIARARVRMRSELQPEANDRV